LQEVVAQTWTKLITFIGIKLPVYRSKSAAGEAAPHKVRTHLCRICQPAVEQQENAFFPKEHEPGLLNQVNKNIAAVSATISPRIKVSEKGHLRRERHDLIHIKVCDRIEFSTLVRDKVLHIVQVGIMDGPAHCAGIQINCNNQPRTE